MPKQLQISVRRAFQRQNGMCCYCGLPMWRPGCQDGPSEMRCTAEHLRARSEGGDDRPSNIAAAHKFCNVHRHRSKRPLEPVAFGLKVQQRIRTGRWLPHQLMRWAKARVADASIPLASTHDSRI